MTEEIEARDILNELSRAARWIRDKHGLGYPASITAEFEEEFKAKLGIDDYGIARTVRFNTPEAYTFFILRWCHDNN